MVDVLRFTLQKPNGCPCASDGQAEAAAIAPESYGCIASCPPETTTTTTPPPPPYENRCGTLFTATCSNESWVIAAPTVTCDECEAFGWDLDPGNECLATKKVCDTTICVDPTDCSPAGDPPAPVVIPDCCTTTTTTPPPTQYCNCPYESTYDCLAGVWDTPILVSPCTTDASDDSTAWAYKAGEACVAEIIVSATGACD